VVVTTLDQSDTCFELHLDGLRDALGAEGVERSEDRSGSVTSTMCTTISSRSTSACAPLPFGSVRFRRATPAPPPPPRRVRRTGRGLR
jgi:hypothetical protein